MIRVQGGIQNYAWGKKGSSSMVTLFTSHIVESASYAEYWLGTHPDAPTLSNNQNISSITGNLHYLFKLLSIAQPLSIQVHPNKAQAVELHSQNTSLYPDDNYKPEMCIAVSPMKLFYGFKSQEEISDVLQSTPELKNLVGELQDLPIMIQKLYENENVTKEYVNQYIERTRGSDNIYELTNSFYPGDTGVFFSMFMHYLEINPGEAILIHPTDPHAYIEGECIEAMATSNNVIRAGLTPKLKDVQCLLRVIHI